MEENNKIWLQVPTEVVRNIGFNIDEKSFAVYVFLLYKKFKSYNDVLYVDHNALKTIMKFKDNRTLKKCFNVLYEQGLIKSPVEKFPINKYLEIELVHPFHEKRFTQLPVNLLRRINEVEYTGFRLMFYYESYINRKDIKKDFCYPSYIAICEDLKIKNDKLSKYNNKLKKLKLITITKHEVQFDDPLDEDKFTKYNNHYRVNLFNI